MPTPALLLLIATLLPLASFVLLVFLGKRLGNPLAGYVATIAIAGSFACSLVAMMLWADVSPASKWGMGLQPLNLTMRWIPIGSSAFPNGLHQDHAGFLDLGMYVDSLTIAMFSMITLVSTIVHIFSIGYMHDDKRFSQFFCYLGLFCFSMLGLVVGGTLLQLFIFWELVGLCSYLLIGFWYQKKSAGNAALKAYVTNRIGDVGFLIGIGILLFHVGNVSLPALWILLGDAGFGGAVTLPNGEVFTSHLLTLCGIGLFCGAMGKSAQFPLHVWLPDAMEGPTPISALIHAATMVAAGVYLVGRIFPILTPEAKLFIAIIGCVTLTLGALIAMTQRDIKKILAFSTISQLGFMMLAMGVGSWIGGLFHLITHAFFKALLFLGAGSVLHAMHHERDIARYGGLLRKLPVTAVCFGLAVLAIAGVGFGHVGFSGFYSKDLVLAHAAAFTTLAHHAGKSAAWGLFFTLPAAVAYVTAFYMARCWMLTFWGKPRDLRLYSKAREAPIMWIPMVALAVLTIISGAPWFNVTGLLNASIRETTAYCQQVNPQFRGFQSRLALEEPTDERGPEARDSRDAAPTPGSVQELALLHGRDLVKKYVAFAFVFGIGLAIFFYSNGYQRVRPLMKVGLIRWLHTWLYHKMYFDELYMYVFVAITLGFAGFSAWFDQYIVDGLVNATAWCTRRLSMAASWTDDRVVDGAIRSIASLTRDVGSAARAPQTGRIRLYVTLLLAAVAVGIAGAIVVVILHSSAGH